MSVASQPTPGSSRREIASALDRRLRRRLPRPTYEIAVGRYNGLRKVVRRGPGRGRLLPDFVIIGAAKAGTTSLYGWLSEHPFVAPASQKEVHYFDYNYFRGDDWYRKHFPLEVDQARFAAEHGRPFITGEASPPYISHQWAPGRLARTLPRAKLLVGLRNPVDRAYSQYQMSRREHEEPLDSFLDAVEAEADRLAPEVARVESSRHYNSWPIGCWSYLLRSRYAEGLQRWFELLPRSQFHFITLEQLSRDPQAALDAVHDFLEIPAHVYAELRPLHTASYDTMGTEARARLTEYFRPHNERLYELVGTDFGWDA
jgi:hypothetical protein